MKKYVFLFLAVLTLPMAIFAQTSQISDFNSRNNAIMTSDYFKYSFFTNELNNQYYYSVEDTILDRSGSTKFLVGNIVYSLSFYGWMVPLALNVDDLKAGIVTYAVVGAGGIIGPHLLTKNKSISIAQAKFKNYGQFKGLVDGTLFDFTIEEDDQIFVAPLILSIGEGTMGYFMPKILNMSKNQVIATSNYGIMGYGLGYLTSRTFFNVDKTWSSFMIMGSFTGEMAGYFISKKNNFTAGDTYAMVGSSFYGAGLGASVLMFSDDPDTLFPALTTGYTLGLIAGTYLGSKYNLLKEQGIRTDFFGLATGLIAGGITALSLPVDKYKVNIFAPVVALSSAAGYVYFYRYYVKKNQTATKSFNSKINFNFNFDPAAAFAAYKSRNSLCKYQNQYMPIAQFQWQF